MSISLPIHPIWESLLRLFYPAYCASCASFLGAHPFQVCEICTSEIDRLRFDPLHQIPSGPLPTGISEAWSLYPYEGVVQNLIQSFKFSGQKRSLWIFENDFESSASLLNELPRLEALIPMPADPSRRHFRLYSPAQVLAEKLSKRLQRPMLSHALKKIRKTPPQSDLSREERLINVCEAFAADARQAAGKSLLLVDDVLSTGSTAREAARALKAAGAKKVYLWTLARAEGPS